MYWDQYNKTFMDLTGREYAVFFSIMIRILTSAGGFVSIALFGEYNLVYIGNLVHNCK